MSLSDLRNDLKDTLDSAGIAATVYASVPEAPIAPAVVLVPDTPYLVPTLINQSTTKLEVNLIIACCVAYNSNPGSLDNVEQLVLEVLAALPDGYVVGDIARPTIVQVGASNLLVTELSVTTYYTEGA